MERIPVRDLVDDPYPIYARLRAEAPVSPVELRPGQIVWLVTRYAEARQALSEPRLVNQPPADKWTARVLTEDVHAAINNHLLNTDPPDHTRLRRLVSKVFTVSRVSRLEPRIREITGKLLDSLPTEFDFLGDFAFPMSIQVICELLGVPAADRDRFRHWSAVITGGALSGDDYPAAAGELVAYIQNLAEQKRADPADDLLSELVAVRDGGDRLSSAELTSMVILLLVAGHETAVNLMASGLYLLITHPDQWAKLRADRKLVPTAVEEFLRYEAPLRTAMPRYASEDVEIGGVTIPAGAVVMVGLQAGNRDERRFGPDTLDVTRAPNPHLAFGHGPHFCVGAALGRLEARVAFETLLEKYRTIALAEPDGVRWRLSVLLRALESLPVQVAKSTISAAG